jgi:hypothetical protein
MSKDAVGEMGVRGDLSPARLTKCWASANKTDVRATRSDACSVEVAKVHVETFYFPSPVTRTPEIYHPLRAVAQHPTGINMRLTEGLGNREVVGGNIGDCPGDCVCSVYLDLTVGQTTGHIGQHVAIPPHIPDAATHRAEPIYLCRVVRNLVPVPGAMKLLVLKGMLKLLPYFSTAPWKSASSPTTIRGEYCQL